jgi:hypothetical protein
MVIDSGLDEGGGWGAAAWRLNGLLMLLSGLAVAAAATAYGPLPGEPRSA